MRSALALLITAAGMMAPSVSAADCPIERATYRAIDGAMQAEFREVGKWPEWMSKVAFAVRSDADHPLHWFLFDEGSARYINMISTLDVRAPGWHPPSPDGGPRPLGEMHYFAMDAGLKVLPTFPDAGQPAPTYVFLPDIAEVLWYKAEPKEGVRQSLLKFAGCRAEK